jgi:hypothetical protein
VSQANGPADGIVEENGQTVGEAQHQGYAGRVGNQGIGTRQNAPSIVSTNLAYQVPVHQGCGYDVRSRDRQGLVDQIVIGLY